MYMGSSKSTLKKYSKEIQDLKNEVQALRSVDKNHDGNITKEEFLEWQKKQANKMDSLKDEIKDMKAVDKNHDGIITKKEFSDWQKKQTNKMSEIEAKLEKEISNKYSKILTEKDSELANTKNKLEELTKQLNSLKTINSGLEKQTVINESKTEEINKLQELSKAKIDEFVEQLLADEKVNIGYLPDFVERQLYKNIFNLLIGLLNNILNTTNIGLLGHQLTFAIQPEKN